MKYILVYPIQYYTNHCEKAERETLWNLPSFWGLTDFSNYHKVWTGLEITICLSNLKRLVILGHWEDALFSVTFRKRMFILPLGFPVLYKVLEKVHNCLYPANTVLLLSVYRSFMSLIVLTPNMSSNKVIDNITVL